MNVLVGMLVAIVGLWATAVVSGIVWLRRSNRVSPKIRSRAPLAWMASPGRAAVAHRRLRRAVQGARAALAAAPVLAGSGGELGGVVAEIECQAAAIDDRLVLAARCSPPVRRSLVRGLESQVREIESVSARMATVVLGGGWPPGEAGADAVGCISDRLDALDAAHAELAALEATFASPSFDSTRAGDPHA